MIFRRKEARGKPENEIPMERGSREAREERMRNARTAMTVEYRWLITALNAYAMIDSNEQRYEALVTRLNGNLDYLKNTVLARKGSSEEESEDEGGDTPEGEVTPVKPE